MNDRCPRCRGALQTREMLGGDMETSCLNCGWVEGAHEATAEDETAATPPRGPMGVRWRHPSHGGARL